MTRVFAIVPAAGQSRRMGATKLLLPLGERTVLEHVLRAFVGQPLDQILVVISPLVRELTDLVRPPAEALLLPSATPDMRSTLQFGLDFLTAAFSLREDDAILIALGDQPTIRSETVAMLVKLHQADPTRIRMPVCQGKRGHPTLLPFGVMKELAALPSDKGLNAIIASHPELVCELPTTDTDVLCDMDVPADYRKLVNRAWN